jgi:hypothetical protein
MKERLLCALLVTTVLLCGCSSTKFTEYHGSEVFQGKGGTMRSVDDIDFWEHGDPDRKYRILGIIEESPGHRLPFGRVSRVFSSGSGDRDSAIAKIAHKRGGDAIIIVSGNQEPSIDDDDDSGRHHRSRKLVVIKYVE